MKCAVCGKEIIEFDLTSYEWLGGPGGDPIHKDCKDAWNLFCEKIDNASEETFTAWLKGEINLINENI